MTNLSGLLACPRCDTALDNLTCKACQLAFPCHGGIPWLFADPGAAVSDWKNRWQLALEHMQADLRQTGRALEGGGISDPTRRRLEALAAGYRAQQNHLRSILQPLALAQGGSLETLLALRTRLPASHGIFSYEANVHRDWNWGGQECQTALDVVMEALGAHEPERMLVLGAGAGRLAYDLHQHTMASVTVALDLNPLLAYVGARVSRGDSVHLVEFPRAPRAPEAAAIERVLQAPAPARPGLEVLLADAMRPPFATECFDVVVTPWLLDVLDESAALVIQRINSLLGDGGLWINHGSVAFDSPDPAERLTLEELLDVARRTGFADTAASEQRIPYMDCPDSRHARVESVVTLRGRKTASVNAPARHQSLPDWIVQGRSPVPALPEFRTQAMTTRMHAFIMTLIDGTRSLDDMARLLEEQHLMPRPEAEMALRGFLIKMYEEARRAGPPPTMT
jgi:uncharacterized protein YbaR (Trm112 family)